MKKVTILYPLFTLFALFGGLTSCFYIEEPTDAVGSMPPSSYEPIYMTRQELNNSVRILGEQDLIEPGKIYKKGNLLFVNERYQGIHVIDNADPKKPKKLAFIQIPGSVDIANKGTILYADNGVDLVALDISNPQQPKVMSRVENVFDVSPTPPDGLAVEVDKSKILMYWKKKSK